MSTVTQVTDFQDLYTDLMNRIRADTSATATSNQAKRYINIALHDMHIGQGEKFTWAERSAILVTQDDYNTGTISISQGSPTLTGTGTLWDTNNVFGVNNARTTGRLVINGGSEVYGITTVGGDTSITLSSAFTQADVTDGSYVYFEDEYALAADYLRPLDMQFFDQNQEIELINRREFRMRYPRNKNLGKPRIATIEDRPFEGSTTPVRRVRLWQPPDDFYTLPYNYVTSNLAVTSAGVGQTQFVNDTDEPIVPLQYRHVIVFHALYHWYRDKRDDARSQEAKGEYTDLMIRITGDQEIGRTRPQIRPRLDSYAKGARTPYSRRGSRHVTGSRFDEIR